MHEIIFNLQKKNSYYYYYWKDSISMLENGMDIGLIAQEAEKVYPEIVITDSIGNKIVLYYKLAPILVSAIKEQQDIIIELDNKLIMIKF